MTAGGPASGATPPPRLRRAALDETSFTRKMRYEIAAEEGRAIRGSYAIAVSLGIIWLLMVRFLAATPPAIALLPPDETAPIQVQFQNVPPPPAATAPAPAASRATAPRPAPRPQRPASDIGSAFGGAASGGSNGMVGDVSNVLRGTNVNAAGPQPAAAQGKAVLGYGAGGVGSRTPGRGGLGQGLGHGAGALGGVGKGGAVGFSTIRVSPPSVIRAPKIGGPGRSVSELGSFVRGRQSQLQFCYEEYGLKANPGLAGTVTLAITLTGAGDVTGAEVERRSWAGAGVAAVESCIRSRVLGWKFPASPLGGGTYRFSFVFSK